ncbi:MAG: helix-turn-helix domain-containing protein, partial [Bacteroidota bacterium]|nr:helix-turn-helix domain-containing protein [Bacteroidota bacterium]MDX5430741.1 helix-turn-helix domain-containing protein [Bacteroidota bacterium]MDX5469488.1 helix-turn-helix domain-containing protein [Bacteroidota bacterium]
ELDGYQLSRAIREDASVAHVPIIMLTTVDTEFNELEGYRAGVDAYLLKPFTKEQLIVRVENMIKNRQLCLSRAPQFQPIQKASESYSEDFHRALQKQMEFQLANPDLKVKHLAEAFGLSVSTFERRIKELYETTPKLFIRNYRLDKAKEMLESRLNNVSTIARSCGFDNISYFSLCFREKFGTTPTRVMYA